MLIQTIINILFLAALYYIVGQAFQVLYLFDKFFNIGVAGIITLSSYLFFLFFNQFGVHWSIAIFFAILICLIAFHLFDLIIIKRLKNKDASSLVLLICSLGQYVIIEGLIPIFWGNSTLQNELFPVQQGIKIAGGYTTIIQIITVLFAFLVSLFVILFNKTNLGIQFKAFSENEILSSIFGVKTRNIFVFTSIFSIILFCISGILFTTDIGLSPNVGFNLLLYGIIALIIGGIRSTNGLIFGSIIISTSQFIGGYYFNSKWMDTIAYIILILFLIWKPLGFSGKQLKKVEI